MSRKTITIYHCDRCDRKQESSHGLPLGWFAVRRMRVGGSMHQSHYCCAACLTSVGEATASTEEASDA